MIKRLFLLIFFMVLLLRAQLLEEELLQLHSGTTAEMNSMANPQTGHMILNTTKNTMCYYNGTSWVCPPVSNIPYISTKSTIKISTSDTSVFTLEGSNFAPYTAVSIVNPTFDGTINNVNVISPNLMEINVTTTTTEDIYDIVLSNDGVSNTLWTGNGSDLLQVTSEVRYLFAITTSTQCAEQLPYGPNHITEADNAYFSTEYKNIVHNKMLQIFTVNGVELFRITYNFATSKTLQDRISDAVNSGESVNWVVDDGTNTYNYGPHLWWYSDGAVITSSSAKWTNSGSGWSDDDGSWGAAPNNVDGNGGPYETWGHGNHNSSDSTCSNYYIDGTQYNSSNIKSYMYMVVP